MNGKGQSDEVSGGNEEHILETGRKAMLVTKQQEFG